MEVQTFFLVLWLIVTLLIAFALWISHSEVSGLRGGYGQGAWAESSTFLREAREGRCEAFFALLVCLAIDALLIYDILQ